MLKLIQRFLTFLLLFAGGAYLLYQGILYYPIRNNFPQGMNIAGVDVSGLSAEETADLLTQQYAAPISIYHQEERLEILPAEVGFAINVEALVQEALAQQPPPDVWEGFFQFLIGRSFEPVTIPLQATHDRELLRQRLQTIASFLDQPAQGPQLLAASDSFQMGQAGFATDIEASLPAVEQALYTLDNRQAHLVVQEQPAPGLSMEFLRQNLERQIEAFSGVGSIYVLDLETGEELAINADQAISGLSILKIAIFEEAYRALDVPPNEFVQGLFYDTAVLSSNYGANLLLHVAAGEDNTYRGVDVLTESMRRLGLVNTFMAVPYDATAPATRPSTYTTPANSDPNKLLAPDPAMQTTAEEIGTLLSMIYYCSKGGGALLAIYPNDLTPAECQAILDLMVQNEEGNLIRFGVPEDVPVSHKHGWDLVTHGDAGVVFSPGGDYVIVEYLSLPDSDWLNHEVSFPILREISRAVYNYFNFETPNLEDPIARAEREAAVRATATAQAVSATLPTETPTVEGTPNGETAVSATPTP